MKALCWFDPKDVRLEDVSDPAILSSRDAILKVTSTAICGTDLHVYNGYLPRVEKGTILGHEFMGEVVELGKDSPLLKGERLVVSGVISCGGCFYCNQGLTSLCDNSNPNGWMTRELFGYPTAGVFGMSAFAGGYAGGQAEYVRVPYADSNTVHVPDELEDSQVLFLSDILPAAYMAVERAQIEPGDTVAVWGCGPVGQLVIRCCYLLGARRVIATDRFPHRLEMAQEYGKAEVFDYEQREDVVEELKERTGGIGPDVCIDAVGMEAHSSKMDGLYDRAKQALRMPLDRIHVLREAIQACRKGGTISAAGYYAGYADKFPLGIAFAKGLTIRMGNVNVQHYVEPLLEWIRRGDLDASYIVSHELKLDDAPLAYEVFNRKEDECVKIVLKP